uniref:BRCT domain-containing protein n=1 Tax=Pyxicephalus adspersus TaxID=30357 RepID=A0AAV3A1J2_PYXAD|nr:TPA: hypothetical protein GDO54_017323 [Pyxicephalus adspersus]
MQLHHRETPEIVTALAGGRKREHMSGGAVGTGGSENEIVLASAKNTENESRILELPEQSESTSAPPPKKPVRGKRQAAPKAIQDDTQESELISTPLEKQGDLKGPTSRTPKSHEGDDTNASQNKEADQTGPEAQHFRNTRPIRRLSNVKGEVKEGSQIGEQPGKLLSKRATRGNQKKEKNSQQALEDNPDTSTLSKRTRKRSREESPKPGQVTEVEKTGEDDTVQQTRKTRRSYREEQKTDANEESLKSSSTAEAQTKITRRGSRRVAVIDQKEIVKETVTRKRRYSKPDAQLENQPKTSARGRKVLKQEDAEETTTEIIKEAKAAQNISRRTRSGNRANEKIGTEHEPDKEVSQSQISSKNRKKASDDSHTLMESTEPKDKVNEATEKRENEIPSSYDEMPRKGTPPAKETAQVFTPVASRKRGKVPKAEVELQRKNSDDGQGAEEEVPSRRRGRARKVTDDSNTSTSGGEISNCEPLCRTRTHRGNTSTLSARPYVPRLGAKTKVLFTGVVIEMGEDTIRLLGGEIAESVFDCTHLITDRVRRTLKFLCALARGIPIVSLDWLDKCKKNGCFLSYTKFLVKDEEQEKKFNFVLSESLQKAKRKPLFEGYEFHVTPNVKPDPDFMKDIICCSGATYLPDFPQTFKEKRIIVSTPEEAVQLKKSVPAGIPVTSPEILLSGILQQRINVAAYLLSSP